MSADAATPGRYARVIRQDVRSMHAYAIQDSAGLVKLDAMENPHRLPEALQAELGKRLGELALNRYPGERVNLLRDALAAHAGMPEGFDIMLGNGSDEIISLIAENGWRAAEEPVEILYTDYSMSKGQPLLNGVNIVFDGFLRGRMPR